MGFFDLPPKTLAIIGFLIGLTLIDDLNANQQNSLGNFLQLIGQTLEVSAAQQQSISSNNSESRISQLEKELEALKKNINR